MNILSFAEAAPSQLLVFFPGKDYTESAETNDYHTKRGYFMKYLLLNYILEPTAWPMEPTAPGSVFHLALSFILISLALLLAWKLRHLGEPQAIRLLTGLGILLFCCELYKQLFIYYIENNGHYNWWYFPFQLCSLPMYLCLFLPFLTARKRALLFTFMYQYNLLGALLVFAEPSGLMHPYWTLTLHGFFWHGILVFIGFFILFSGRTSSGNDVFLKTTALFLSCCAIAAGINVLSRQVALPPWQDADMFYISPFYPNTQIVFHQIAERFGISAGNIAYLAAIIAGAFLMKEISDAVSKHRKKSVKMIRHDLL